MSDILIVTLVNDQIYDSTLSIETGIFKFHVELDDNTYWMIIRIVCNIPIVIIRLNDQMYGIVDKESILQKYVLLD